MFKKFLKHLIKCLVVFIVILLCYVPIHSLYDLINKYAVNVLSIDDLFLVNLFGAIDSKDLSKTLTSFFSPINAHLFLTGKFLLLILYKLFNFWNIKNCLLLSYSLGILSSSLISFLFWKTSKSIKLSLIFTPVPFFILLSPSASENWMISVQVCQFLSIFLFLVSIFTLYFFNKEEYSSKSNLIFASIFAFLSTFSYGSGFVSYIAGYPLIALKDHQKFLQNKDLSLSFNNFKILNFKKFFFWMASATFTLLLYLAILSIYTNTESNPDLGLTVVKDKAFDNPFKILRFFLQITGSPIGIGISSAPYIYSGLWGLIELSLYFTMSVLTFKMAYRKAIDLIEVYPWISIGFFAICTNFLTSVSRSYINPNQSLNPRYISASSLLIVSIIAMSLILLRAISIRTYYASSIRKPLRTIKSLGLLITILAILSYHSSWESGLRMIEYISSIRLQSLACITFINYCPDKFVSRTLSVPLFKMYYDTAIDLNMIELEQGYVEVEDGFYDNRAIKYGHFDGFEKDALNLDDFQAWGWALPIGEEWTGTVVLTKEPSMYIIGLASANLDSLDLVDYLGNDIYKQVRWRVSVPSSLLNKGSNLIKAWTFDSTQNQLVQIGNVHNINVD